MTSSGDLLKTASHAALADFDISQLRLMAERGSANAQNELGTRYETGRGGVEENKAEAIRWFRRAAEQRHARAEYSLGIYYRDGLGGVERDLDEAARWFRCAAVHGDEYAKNTLAWERLQHVFNKRLIGSRLALVLGTSGMLSGLSAYATGVDTTALMTGPVMILGAAAYSSRKRRLLGLKPETMVRKTFEAVCLTALATLWLGHLDLANEVRQNPVSHLMVPLWALIAYPCASFRTEKHRVAEPVEESWVKLRAFLWATPITMALTFAGLAALLVLSASAVSSRAGNGNSLQDLALPQPAHIETLRTARTLRCNFDDMSSEIVIDAVNHDTDGFGEARILGNVGASDALSVLGREMVSFVEFPANAVNTITVYPVKDNELRFVAVYSRHTAVFGTPTPSQQSGSCQVLE